MPAYEGTIEISLMAVTELELELQLEYQTQFQPFLVSYLNVTLGCL